MNGQSDESGGTADEPTDDETDSDIFDDSLGDLPATDESRPPVAAGDGTSPAETCPAATPEEGETTPPTTDPTLCPTGDESDPTDETGASTDPDPSSTTQDPGTALRMPAVERPPGSRRRRTSVLTRP